MPTFELLVHDLTEDYERSPATLQTLRHWTQEVRAGHAPFTLDLDRAIGFRVSDDAHELVEERVGGLVPTALGCRAAAARLEQGRAAVLRSSGFHSGLYFLFSAGDPVRMTWVYERRPAADPFPFFPGPFGDGSPEEVQALLVWVDAEAERLLQPSGNAAHDQARGLTLRVPRAALIADLNAEATLALDTYALLTGLFQG